MLIEKTYNKVIEFKDCKLFHNGDYTTIIFNDGTETSNWPLPNDPFYVEIAASCGFDKDHLMDYCFEHEFFHIFIPLNFFIEESYVATRTARRIKMSISAAKAEERLVYYFQRYKGFPDKNQALDENWPILVDEANRLLYDTTHSTE